MEKKKNSIEAVAWDILKEGEDPIRVEVCQDGSVIIFMDEDTELDEEQVTSLIEVLQNAKKVIHNWDN